MHSMIPSDRLPSYCALSAGAEENTDCTSAEGSDLTFNKYLEYDAYLMVKLLP